MQTQIKTITQDNLAEADAQEVFDFIANHLLTQNKRCEVEVEGQMEPVCRYFDENTGDKCAAGCLLTPEFYGEIKDSFEGKTWGSIICYTHVPDNHELLISKLQTLHDTEEPKDWKQELKELAEGYGLNTQALDIF